MAVEQRTSITHITKQLGLLANMGKNGTIYAVIALAALYGVAAVAEREQASHLRNLGGGAGNWGSKSTSSDNWDSSKDSSDSWGSKSSSSDGWR